LSSKAIAFFSSTLAFDLAIASEMLFSFLFICNTIFVSVGSDMIKKELGKRIMSIDLLRAGS
jgi:hypothetical protein